MISSGDSSIDKVLWSKISTLEAGQKLILDKFVDRLLKCNFSLSGMPSKDELADQFVTVITEINEDVYKKGMTPEIAQKIVNELS